MIRNAGWVPHLSKEHQMRLIPTFLFHIAVTVKVLYLKGRRFRKGGIGKSSVIISYIRK